MKSVIKILKGILIGIANIIPGLSGGTIAVSMGIYEELIFAVNNIFKDFKNVVKNMWAYILGIGIGIILGVFGIVVLFNLAPIPTTMFFVGLILGSIPDIAKKVDAKPLRMKDLIIFIILSGIIIFLPVVNTTPITSLNSGIVDIVIMLGLGLIAAATMVIPGVSGSMMLMALGYYSAIMATISICLKDIVSLNIIDAVVSGKMLIPFAIGIVIGIFLMAKLIASLISKDETFVYWGILGLIVSSPFPIIIKLNLMSVSILELIFSICLLFVGMYFTVILSKISKDKEQKKE